MLTVTLIDERTDRRTIGEIEITSEERRLPEPEFAALLDERIEIAKQKMAQANPAWDGAFTNVTVQWKRIEPNVIPE